jgi:hypothetical protein
VVGSFLYLGRAIDSTILMGLNAIANEQSNPTEQTCERVLHLLDYLATHPDAIVRFYASDMILNVHSDASYLSAPKAKSRAAGYYFLGSMPQDGQPIPLNGAIHVLCTLLKFVASSAAEAELGALFLNAKEAKIMHLGAPTTRHPHTYRQLNYCRYCEQHRQETEVTKHGNVAPRRRSSKTILFETPSRRRNSCRLSQQSTHSSIPPPSAPIISSNEELTSCIIACKNAK